MDDVNKIYWNNKEVVFHFSLMMPSDDVIKLVQNYPITAKVLDLGCGAGRHTIYLAKKGFDVYACDYSEAMISYLKKSLMDNFVSFDLAKVYNLSILDLDFPDNFFDVILCSGVLHNLHSVSHIQSALKIQHSLLVDNGILYISIFFSDKDCENQYNAEKRFTNLLLPSLKLLNLFQEFYEVLSYNTYSKLLVNGKRNILKAILRKKRVP